MAYKYGGTETIEAELERISKEREEAKNRIRERNTLLQQLRRERRRLEKLAHDELVVEQKLRELTTEPKQLPEPRWGGPSGLKAATDEARNWKAKRPA